MPSGEQDFQSNYHYFLSFFKSVNPHASAEVRFLLSGQITYKFYLYKYIIARAKQHRHKIYGTNTT